MIASKMDELPRYEPINDPDEDDRRLEIVKTMLGCLFILVIFLVLYYYDSLF